MKPGRQIDGDIKYDFGTFAHARGEVSEAVKARVRGIVPRLWFGREVTRAIEEP
jgi:hypothetical protein